MHQPARQVPCLLKGSNTALSRAHRIVALLLIVVQGSIRTALEDAARATPTPSILQQIMAAA